MSSFHELVPTGCSNEGDLLLNDSGLSLQVSTFDGFLLSLQLIQRNDWIGQSFAGDVLFWHSALLGGRSWFVADNPTPLAMADAGYSVWIAHARGTEYTFGHQMLTPNQKEFWNWDMDEWANYDFPAITDFVFYATKGRKFHFVGYSQGARVGIGAISYQWNRATMLASVSLIAPVVFMVNTISPVLVAYNYTRLAELAYKIGVGKISFASITDSSTTSQKLTELKREGLCQFTGPNCCIDSDKVFRVMTGPYSLTTYKNLDHIAQSMKSQVFKAYDFGSPNANIGVYQNSEPPTYHLQQVPNTIPLFVLYGGHDRLSTPTDVDYFVSQLSTVPEILFHPLYAHLDFIFSRSLGLDINLPLLTFIGKNSNFKG
ncbi:hypothetical protein AXG93_369s1330 [Marchantia polymorpha subsp. ruderalis]|uniref:Lipase n=1 Tax=Marchantia polymorpha subsp. ruderalis TaxID=1480154 RepID=A0A176VSN7_MARPO|nr:hypothetical protein AXG93_369s1330 [Marchantia polymorpha subsp. ruderalis]